MGRYAQARRRASTRGGGGLAAPPVPEFYVEGDDLVVTLGWTTAATTAFEIWGSVDDVNYTLEVSDSISAEEGGWVQEWAYLGLEDLYLKFRIFGDGVAYDAAKSTDSLVIHTPDS